MIEKYKIESNYTDSFLNDFAVFDVATRKRLNGIEIREIVILFSIYKQERMHFIDLSERQQIQQKHSELMDHLGEAVDKESNND